MTRVCAVANVKTVSIRNDDDSPWEASGLAPRHRSPHVRVSRSCGLRRVFSVAQIQTVRGGREKINKTHLGRFRDWLFVIGVLSFAFREPLVPLGFASHVDALFL